jgi:pimeloyl-ACP methyl ester carboxylesterase
MIMNRKRNGMSILSTVILIYIGFCAYLYLAQRSLIYFPTPESRNVAAEDLRLELDGETVQIWRLNADKDEAIIYFGGNAETVAYNIGDFSRIFPDKAIYLVNYRGYGASTGKPSEAAIAAHAQAIYDHASQAHANISVVGRSLGSGVAIFLAATRTTQRLVLITPWDSMVSVAQSAYPIFPVSTLLKDRYDSLSHASSISIPTLLLIAGRDEFIPMKSSLNLAEALDPSLTTVTIIDDAGHNTIQNYDQYMTALAEFLQ